MRAMNPDPSAPVLDLSGIHKAFPGVKALSDVRLRLFPGEVHALMGQNGAGKSTLIKVLTGLYTPDAGSITLDGQPIAPKRTEDAQALGIRTVYQEVNLCPNLSVAENICAGRFPRTPWWSGGRIDWPAVHAEARRVLGQMDLDIDVTQPLSRYSLSIQQMVAIARALRISARVLILDEPTAALNNAEIDDLFKIIRHLKGFEPKVGLFKDRCATVAVLARVPLATVALDFSSRVPSSSFLACRSCTFCSAASMSFWNCSRLAASFSGSLSVARSLSVFSLVTRSCSMPTP